MTNPSLATVVATQPDPYPGTGQHLATVTSLGPTGSFDVWVQVGDSGSCGQAKISVSVETRKCLVPASDGYNGCLLSSPCYTGVVDYTAAFGGAISGAMNLWNVAVSGVFLYFGPPPALRFYDMCLTDGGTYGQTSACTEIRLNRHYLDGNPNRPAGQCHSDWPPQGPQTAWVRTVAAHELGHALSLSDWGPGSPYWGCLMHSPGLDAAHFVCGVDGPATCDAYTVNLRYPTPCP